MPGYIEEPKMYYDCEQEISDLLLNELGDCELSDMMRLRMNLMDMLERGYSSNELRNYLRSFRNKIMRNQK